MGKILMEGRWPSIAGLEGFQHMGGVGLRIEIHLSLVTY